MEEPRYNITCPSICSVEPGVKPFLTVVAKDYTLKADGAQVLFQQGARLQLADKKASAYTVKVPVRTKEGKLQEEKVVLAANASLHEGYLPYTTNNIIRSAFKFYDSVYAWGGLQQSVDFPVLSVMLTVQ